MSMLGWLGISSLAFAGAIVVGGLYMHKSGQMRKKELKIYLATAILIVAATFVVAPMTLWDRYEVSGVVEEVHPGGLLELSGGRVMRVGDDRVVTLRKGDVVDMTCETVHVSSRNEACQVNW